MELARTRGRTARGIENDRRILDAAIPVVARKGIDRMTLRDVAAQAGLTYGALYGRYENVVDLLADLWTQRLEAEVAALASAAAAALAEPVADTAARELVASTPARVAAVQVLIGAARVADLGDVVPAGVARAVDAAGLRSVPGGPAAGIGLLAIALGSAAHGPIDGTLEADAPAIVAAIRAAASSGKGAGGARGRTAKRAVEAAPVAPAGRAAGAAPAAPDIPSTGRFSMPGEPQREILLNAALAVVARSGIANATLRRISRASGYSHIAVYTTYGSLDALVVDLIQSSVMTAPPAERLLQRITDVDVLAARLAGWAHPDAAAPRRVMGEFLIGSLSDPRLGTMTSLADTLLYERVASLVAPAGSAANATLVRTQQVVRDLVLGIATLMCADLTPGVEDWGPLARSLVSGAPTRA
jgi:hypothetical protein